MVDRGAWGDIVQVLGGRDFWIGTFCGALVTVLATEPIRKTLQSVLAPDSRVQVLEQENGRLRDRADAGAVEAQICRKKLAESEFSKEAATLSMGVPSEACVRELDTIKSLSIKERTAARLVGGRLYVGAEDAWTEGAPAGCRLNITTDISSTKSTTNLQVGKSTDVLTGIGDYRIILAGVPDGVTCVVDVVRPR